MPVLGALDVILRPKMDLVLVGHCCHCPVNRMARHGRRRLRLGNLGLDKLRRGRPMNLVVCPGGDDLLPVLPAPLLGKRLLRHLEQLHALSQLCLHLDLVLLCHLVLDHRVHPFGSRHLGELLRPGDAISRRIDRELLRDHRVQQGEGLAHRVV